MIADEAEAREWLRRLPTFDRAAEERLELLVGLLAEENTRQNLVSAASLGKVWRRHIVDSAQLLAHVSRETTPWLDLGTGAGFPGLVIAALLPDQEVLLVESRARRIDWLQRAASALGLRHVRIIGASLERVPDQKVRVISARAFASLPKLLELAARFSTSDTRWLLPKGRSAAQELSELENWENMFHVEQSLTDPNAGIIVGELLQRKGPKV
ncbi:MAG TPA: 16S rRNA (guanine(527)-N(7))-methyltransferase RsmG [Novosphingobium sp.]|nr:16S rRNA (guanine(527)-N(7))-methyltransferase RsmG [Novosphingobium sp.]